MPQLDFSTFAPQLIWLAISFVVLYLLMSRVALPRIATVIEQRRDRIASDLDEAHRLKQETDEVIAAYEAELAEARAKAHGIAADNRDKLNAELDRERASVEAEIAGKAAEAEKAIAEMRSKAMGELDQAAADTTGEVVKLLIGKAPSEKEVADAVKAALAG